MLCTAYTILDTCAANSLHLITAAGSDYTPVATDLTFSSTNAAIPQTVTIPILDDLLLEGSEVFNVTLTTNNSNVTLLPNLVTLTIEDWEGKLKEEISCLTTLWLPLVTDTLKQQGDQGYPRLSGLPNFQILITCSIQKWREKAWGFLPHLLARLATRC